MPNFIPPCIRDVLPNKKGPGRPKKTWAEQARVLVWYEAVKETTGWNNYQMDMAFAWSDDIPVAHRNGADRPRTFESIQKSATIPSRGKHWNSNVDIVNAVGGDPRFVSTKALYEAPLWEILNSMSNDLTLIHGQVEEFFDMHKLIRVDPLDHQVLVEAAFKSGLTSLYVSCLKGCLRKLSELESLTLLCLLVREAELVRNSEIIEVLRRECDAHLDTFFHRYLKYDLANYFYTEAINCFLLGSSNNISSDQFEFRSSLFNCVSWPIIGQNNTA